MPRSLDEEAPPPGVPTRPLRVMLCMLPDWADDLLQLRLAAEDADLGQERHAPSAEYQVERLKCDPQVFVRRLERPAARVVGLAGLEDRPVLDLVAEP